MNDTPVERGNSIWTRLRRRKVVQWGVAYAAAAWLLMQLLEYFSGTYDWPREIQQLTTLALLIGLPIVLVLAYYHGDRGQQRITTTEFAILTLLLLLGGGAFWYYQRTSETERDAAVTAETAQPPASPAVSDARPSVAVLPFENRSREADDAFFVDGIHDDILTQLSKISALRVISRTSVEQFRDTKLSMKGIADQLGVTKILEGGVQRAGDRVRVTVQLIDVANDAHLWAESYDRELSAANIFAIQSELAAAIAGALKTSLTPAEKARARVVPTQKLEAWEAYQLGKQRMATRVISSLADAERYFRQAVALDPTFAMAWAGVAEALILQTTYGARPVDTTLDEAEAVISRALELDPNLAEAWTASAGIAQNRGQHERAAPLLRKAIALNPNYAAAHAWLSESLAYFGLRQEALLEAERARLLDPLSAVITNQVGIARTALGRFDDALVAYRRAAEIDPTMAISYANVGDIHAQGYGHFDKAAPWYIKSADLDADNATAPALLAILYWDLSDEVELARWLSRALAIGEQNALANAAAAILYLDQGEMEAARRHAVKAGELYPYFMFLISDHDVRARDYATARARYAVVVPRLLSKELPEKLTHLEAFAAVDLAMVLQHTGESERAGALLDLSAAYLRPIPRMGVFGYGYTDARIHALRGETVPALAALREAERAGYRTIWRYYRDFDPALASIRNEPEFKAVFADIERDMAKQRARLAARPKDAPLELTEASR